MNEKTFFEDWTNLTEDFDKLVKDADNPFFKSKYVPLKQILPMVKDKCKKHNFIFLQYPVSKDDKKLLRTEIRHLSGEIIRGEIELVAKDPSDPQKLGGSITYMRRYSLTCMFGLEEEDDDGNNSSAPASMPMEKVYDLAKYGKLICAECNQSIPYEEYKIGDKAGQPKPLKCKNWKHKGFKEKKEITDKVPF